MQELWDLYDSQRRPLHRQLPRGVPLEPGTYHLVIEALVLREDGRLLLTQRHPDKPYGLLWECTGGSALCGEDSLSAALRELQEETGLHFAPQQAHLLRSWQRVHSLVDSWLFRPPSGKRSGGLPLGRPSGNGPAVRRRAVPAHPAGPLRHLRQHLFPSAGVQIKAS